jgi:predicted TIM-barrel fold metal-dependent hydrolase
LTATARGGQRKLGRDDRLNAAVAANPKRFAAFAALPTSDPKAAADELERTAKLGFKGAMIHGLANGAFLDDKQLLADLRARAGARRADLPASGGAAAGGSPPGVMPFSLTRSSVGSTHSTRRSTHLQ